MSQDPRKNAPDKDEQPVHFNVIDRRIFADPESLNLDAVEAPKPRYPTYVEELMARVAETERRFEEKKKEMQDEISRIRTRLESDLERRLLIEKQKMLEPLLEVLDNLERALTAPGDGDNIEGLRHGIEMTAALFRRKLQSLGVEAIPVVDEPYDPNVGEAVGVVPASEQAQDGLVLEEVLRGYRMGDRVLRPARVRVGRFEG